MKKLTFLLALGLMTVFSAQSVFAENTVYTSYNSSTKTLTYYYDDHYGYSDRPNSVLFQPTSDIARWADYHDEVTKVVIDASMANAELTSLRRMFNGGGSNYLSNVTSITGMSNLKTATVTSMESMFYGCVKLTSIDVSGFNTANVTLMDFMFYDCNSLTSLDLSNFNTAKVTDMRYMFCYCKALKSLNISSFNTAKVARMQYMFNNCSNLTSLDLMKFRFDALINTSYMFAGCSKLVTIYCGANLTEKSELTYANSVDMFSGCWKLVGGKGTEYGFFTYDDKSGARPDNRPDEYGYFSTKPVLYAEINGATMYIRYDDQLINIDLDWNADGMGTYTMSASKKNQITEVNFLSSVRDALPTSCRRWFYGLKNLKSITGLNYLNTSEVTNMRAMFSLCNSLESLDVSKFNTAKVTDMFDMFNQCNKLTLLNVTNFNTSNVTNMGYMFCGCQKIGVLDVSYFNTEKVTDMKYMFSGCTNLLEMDLRKFNTAKVTTMQSMFNSCTSLKKVYLPSNLSKVTNTSYMFSNCTNLKTIMCDFDFNASSALTSSTDMFIGCTALVGPYNTKFSDSHIDKSYARPDHGTNLPGYFTPIRQVHTYRNGTVLFYYYNQYYDSTDPNDALFDPIANPSAERWADYASQITDVVIHSSMAEADLPSLKGMFYGGNRNYLSNLTTIQNMGNLNTENVTDMREMFKGCYKLPSLDLSGFNTAKVTDMSNMFDLCEALTELDLTSFNTANVTNMYSMFYGCKSLATLKINANFKTNKVTNMTYMFSSCESLTSLNLSGFNTANVTKMNAMFNNCASLETLNISNFNTAKVENMASMFAFCDVLKSLNLDRFITSNVTDMSSMFYGCANMESISLPDDMSKVTNASHMFKNCLKLKTITCDFDFSASSALTNSTEMFFNCTSLKGGNGTVFNYSKINKEYAHVDEAGNPGYFTKSSATGIDNVQSDKVQGTKVLRDGQIYILRDGKTYNVMGMEIR